MKRTRILLPAALAVAALVLTGCSGGTDNNKDAAGKACTEAGAASNSVKVSGKVGSDLKLTSKTPIQSKAVERTVLTDGEGAMMKDGDKINVTMTMFSGADGSSLQSVPKIPLTFAEDQLSPWAFNVVRCALPGQTVAVTTPVTEVYGEQLGGTNLKKDDSVVIVMEFSKFSEAKQPELLKRAEGTAQKAPAGFPTVKLADDGKPEITIPKGEKAPSKLQIATLIEGKGAEVKPGDTVWVHYRGVIWSTGKEFDSSWAKGEPAKFTTDGVIGGFQKALEGQKVGSQVIAVVPAEDGGYGADELVKMGHKKDDVMVFVLDILGTQSAN